MPQLAILQLQLLAAVDADATPVGDMAEESTDASSSAASTAASKSNSAAVLTAEATDRTALASFANRLGLLQQGYYNLRSNTR